MIHSTQKKNKVFFWSRWKFIQPRKKQIVFSGVDEDSVNPEKTLFFSGVDDNPVNREKNKVFSGVDEDPVNREKNKVFFFWGR